ncbi:hypothetical protein ACIA8J_29955 [Streptomyces asoensis]|uniref:hypothetical protein n=1 Tax=Streptomyces asoensis TaxID=249586 RepID=UPI0037B17B39
MTILGEAFTSVRIFEAILPKAENPGSSSPASTTFSSAMLIRSTGRFFAAASLRIDCSTIPRPGLVVRHADLLADKATVMLGRPLRLVR